MLLVSSLCNSSFLDSEYVTAITNMQDADALKFISDLLFKYDIFNLFYVCTSISHSYAIHIVSN